MYAVEVRDHIMIAHSLSGEVFGPAQKLHGATFIVDVAYFRESLSEDNIVVDIGLATSVLKSILEELNYSNLDELPATRGHVTTTEYLSRFIFDRMTDAIHAGKLGHHANGVKTMRVKLSESHTARAWYEGPLR